MTATVVDFLEAIDLTNAKESKPKNWKYLPDDLEISPLDLLVLKRETARKEAERCKEDEVKLRIYTKVLENVHGEQNEIDKQIAEEGAKFISKNVRKHEPEYATMMKYLEIKTNV